ncbi:hypothetical protein L208DRAFT_1558238 [Tricholoma matsutake]|nr:hypothetical protein L208DRAFT_1558238 [Tricholoma matsutake 945]
MKDCPMLTAGKITPLIMQFWTLACKWYMKHASNTPAEIVSFLAEGMFKPQLIGWYQADQFPITQGISKGTLHSCSGQELGS